MKKKIYILAPANTATGGPESLHQLASSLKKYFKFSVTMYYLPSSKSSPVHSEYKHYKINYTYHIEDNKNNILIIPEYYFFLKESQKFKKIKKIIWWLSVDNYFISKFRTENSKYLRSIILLPYKIISFFSYITRYNYGLLPLSDYLKKIYSFRKIVKLKEFEQIKFHLAQSKYAYNFLKKNNFKKVKFMPDYQKKIFLEETKKNKKKKEDLICYYPFKNNEYINQIIFYNKNLKFIPIINFSTKEVIKLLNKTKIYIDFGFHPGKDRVPREAVLMGNCIITNKRGSAGNDEDIPILNEFKFLENRSNLSHINKKIIQIFNNYEHEFLKFKKYYFKILSEQRIFDKQVKKNFI